LTAQTVFIEYLKKRDEKYPHDTYKWIDLPFKVLSDFWCTNNLGYTMKTLKLLLNHEWSEETKRKRIKPKESEQEKEQKNLDHDQKKEEEEEFKEEEARKEVITTYHQAQQYDDVVIERREADFIKRFWGEIKKEEDNEEEVDDDGEEEEGISVTPTTQTREAYEVGKRGKRRSTKQGGAKCKKIRRLKHVSHESDENDTLQKTLEDPSEPTMSSKSELHGKRKRVEGEETDGMKKQTTHKPKKEKSSKKQIEEQLSKLLEEFREEEKKTQLRERYNEVKSILAEKEEELKSPLKLFSRNIQQLRWQREKLRRTLDRNREEMDELKKQLQRLEKIDGLCKICNTGAREDHAHWLIHCPARPNFFNSVRTNLEQMANKNKTYNRVRGAIMETLRVIESDPDPETQANASHGFFSPELLSKIESLANLKHKDKESAVNLLLFALRNQTIHEWNQRNNQLSEIEHRLELESLNKIRKNLNKTSKKLRGYNECTTNYHNRFQTHN
jgi:hypothetical protein